MTNDAVLIQYADGPAHTALMWPRWELIEKAITLRYRHVFWLDADAVTVNMAADLRDALPEDKHFGMLHGSVPGGEPVHWNAGVMYFHGVPLARNFARHMLTIKPSVYFPLPLWWEDTTGDQYLLNRLLAEYPADTAAFVHPMDRKWNTVYGYENGVTPNVLHLAGTPDLGRRLAIIEQTIAEN